MNFAATLVALSLFGIQQDVTQNASGRAEEYIIRLTNNDIDTLRDGNISLKSAISPTRRGGTLYRIYVGDVPDQTALTETQLTPAPIAIKPTNVAGEGVYAINLSAREIEDLIRGAVLGGVLPRDARMNGTRFEVSSMLPAGGSEIRRERELDPLRTRPENRNPAFRDYPRNEPEPADPPFDRNRDFDDRPIREDRSVLRDERSRLDERARVLGDSLPQQPTSPLIDLIRRKSQIAMTERVDNQMLQPVSSAPVSPFPITSRNNGFNVGRGSILDDVDEGPRGNPRRFEVSATPQPKIRPNTGTSISRDNLTDLSPSDRSFRNGMGTPPPTSNMPTSVMDPRLALALLTALISMGANFFLAWQVYSSHMRYRDVIDQVRMGSSWSSESRTSVV